MTLACNQVSPVWMTSPLIKRRVNPPCTPVISLLGVGKRITSNFIRGIEICLVKKLDCFRKLVSNARHIHLPQAREIYNVTIGGRLLIEKSWNNKHIRIPSLDMYTLSRHHNHEFGIQLDLALGSVNAPRHFIHAADDIHPISNGSII